MKLFARLGTVALILAACGTAAQAASLASPGVYYGAGNVNSNFTVASSGIELGLRASLRQNPADVTTVGNTYFVPAGAQTDITSGGNGANASRAAWNYDFSVNTNGVDLSVYSFSMTISDTHGNTRTFDPSAIGDNALSPTGFGFQNSENPVFSSVFVSPYNMNAADTYTISLDAYNKAWGYHTTDTINVNVSGDPAAAAAAVPVPAAAYAGFSMLGGLGLVKWRRRRKNV